MDHILRVAVFTVLLAPALFLAGRSFLQDRDRPERAIGLQAAILYTLCEVLGAAEADYFLLSVFMLFFAFLSACDLTHFLIYRTPISASAFGEILLTTKAEWLDYTTSLHWRQVLLPAGYMATCAAALATFHLALADTQSFALPAGVILGCAVLLTFLRRNAHHFYPLRYAFLIAETATEIVELKRSARATERGNFSAAAMPPPENQKFVVIIGESVRRHNLSIHGYGRDTTPELAGISEELVIFEDAVSAANLTRVSLRLALTSASIADGSKPSERHSIVQAARAAGFETHWISNQPRLGYYETEVSAIAGHAEHVHFLNTDMRGRSPDGRMLPAIADALGTDRPSVIFVHMMGSHLRYEHRIEDAYRQFTADTGYKNDIQYRGLVIDNYDNTILYLDYFLGQIMHRCRDSGKPCLLTFFSDHGHSLFDDGKILDHGLVNPVRTEYEIPYFFWATPDFRRRYPDHAVFKLPQRVPGRAHMQNLFDDLLVVMGLRIDGYESRGTNFGGLPTNGPDDRIVMGREKVFEYAKLP